MTRLEALFERLERAGLLVARPPGFERVEIDHLASDSRKVGPGGLFVAITGGRTDGHLFIDKAVINGAIAVVCEEMPGSREERFPGVVFAQVTNARAALAELAAVVSGDPSDELMMIGVTGTNGKTTVTFLLHHVLTQLGRKTGLIGTVEVRIGEHVLGSNLTTPDPVELHRLLRDMRAADCRACVMEVSSHALHQERVRSIAFDAAVFTNLTRDHLDYHGTFDAYRQAKGRLFDELPADAVAVYNADDPAGALMVAQTRARTVSYGLAGPADLRAEILEDRMDDGLRMRIGQRRYAFRLAGRFNAYNLLATCAAARELGLPEDAVWESLSEAPAAPGRLERFQFADGTMVVVDYAHTPDALENVLQTVRSARPGGAALWCVFGCGGERDLEKRPLMGAVAEQWADRIIVTSDNPRSEDPERIMDDIRAGMRRPDLARWIPDRHEAIRDAARQALPGDVVVIAGKGHETFQTTGTRTIPFDDREVVRALFSDRAANNR